MANKSFKAKIIIPAVVVLITLVVALNAFLYVRFSALNDVLINEKLIANINSLKLLLTDAKDDSRIAAVSMSRNTSVIQAVRERDTEQLLKILVPAQDMYKVNFYTICDKRGVVLARSHDIGRFGDLITNQQNIQDALNGKTSSYFETGTSAKVSVRTGAPVYDTDGSLIGVVSAGTRFDTNNEAEELKRIFNSEVTIFLGNTIIATTITRDEYRFIGATMDPEIEKIVIDKRQEYLTNTFILGEKYKAFYMPLFDADDKVFASFFLGIPETDTIKASNRSIRHGIILGLGGLAVSIVLLFFIISSISRPIIKLSNDMDHIANGNLRIEIDAKSEDEVGKLGKSLQKVANILHKLLDDINIMITEQTKGNTDYCLDTTNFFGDYKKLAENILELASVSMKDQLTGIPNRRSFDNRLEWEWIRAMREKTPLSLLLMDVDKFKNYNDTFGHQQGDIALQIVASTIKNTVKRSIDFCARWGGEEFIVLLPATNQAGAVRVAEEIRKAIEDAVIPCNDEEGHKVTVSIGAGTEIPDPNSEVSHLVSIIDAALYKAKETGRNTVVFGEGSDSTASP